MTHLKIPNEPGWYAVLKCWDAEEGQFPDALYFDGQVWEESRASIQFWPTRFETQEEAKTYVYENDPEFGKVGSDSLSNE